MTSSRKTRTFSPTSAPCSNRDSKSIVGGGVEGLSEQRPRTTTSLVGIKTFPESFL